MSTLTVRAMDPDGGPVPARLYVTDGSGQAVYPTTPHITVRNDRTWASERHFVADGRVDVELPAGQVSVAAERGPEFVPQSVDLELQPDEHRAIDLVVPRWVDMNARGWFSGDLHVHRDASDLPRLLVAEDLNVGTCIATHWRDDPVTATTMPPESDDWLSIVDGTHAFSRFDGEVERLGHGPGAVVAVCGGR